MQRASNIKVFVTGSTGMLGGYLTKILKDNEIDAYFLDRKRYDLINSKGIYQAIIDFKPNFIVHLAAETNVDLCEVDNLRAGQINSMSCREIALASRRVGANLIYVSTSNVFGGGAQLTYNELDTPCPVNYYGKSKLLGENFIRELLPEKYLIIRAGWMIGGGKNKDHKFVGKIIKKLSEPSLSEITAVEDKYGTVTMASSLAEFIFKSIEEERIGLYHFASRGLISRFEIAKIICKFFGSSVSLVPVKSSLFPLSAPRANSEGICSVFLDERDGIGEAEVEILRYLSMF